MIVEWNAHMFSSDVQRYPFHPQAAYLPPDERRSPDPVGAYLQRMETVGIDRAVLVQPEPYGDDHRLLLDCLDYDGERLKGACLFLPRDPDASAKLKSLVRREPRIVALRFHAHRGKEQYLDSFDDLAVRDLWRCAGELGLVIELHIGPNYARQVARAVADYPAFPVLIDHLAEPQMGTSDEYDHVLALGKHRNVTIKLSGLTHCSHTPEPHLDLKPLVTRLARAFGPERLAWSSGSPHLIVDSLLDGWSEQERAQVKGLNLARLAGF
jgi:predicted TIM-barrel fold metal-dependent hydrolase